MELTQIGQPLDTVGPAFFRFRPLGDKVLLTNLEGDFTLVSHPEFQAFATGGVAKGGELWERLRRHNFLRAEYDVERAADRMRARKRFLHFGPNLHAMVVTLRCNETCVYCHASRADMDAVQTDMTKEVAEKSVDIALSSTNPGITIEFQGGEPLVNWPVVKHIVEYALERNKTVGKSLAFTMVSNLSLMDEDKLAFLMKHRVQMCTSIDGPRDIHDKQRKLPGLSAYDATVSWIKRINAAYREAGLDETLYHVEALITVTRDALPMWKEIVDTYAELGCRALFLRPLDPFGFADKTKRYIEYPRADYMAFYRKAVDYIIEKNASGTQILERYAAIFLTKILAGEDPNFLDIRSPGGAGIGQLAYSYDGKVYSSDEGRMLAGMGDSAFLLGDVFQNTYRQLVGHETVRALMMASNLDGQPDCVNCTYQPYCGTVPEHNYKTTGSIFGRMRESTICAVHKGIQDYLFERIGEGDARVMEVFRRWTTVRERAHFVWTPDGATA